MPLAIIIPLWDVGCMTGFMMQHFEHEDSIPIGSMYGIFPYIYHKKATIHVGKYTIDGSYGIDYLILGG